MKKILFLLIMTSMIFCSCGTKEEIKEVNISSAAQLPQAASSVNIKQKTSCFSMKVDGEDNGWLIPSLILYDDKRTYVFQWDLLSNYLSSGSYTEKNNEVICTDLDNHTYVFNRDGNNLTFNKEKSSDVSLFDKNIGYQIEDGTLFKAYP